MATTTEGAETTGLPFVIVNAFTRSVFSGNPAAIVLQAAPFEDTETYMQIARNLNQPMCAFLSPAERTSPEELEAEKAVAFRIRWFTGEHEIPLCGHATMATAHALFNNLISVGGKTLVDQQVKVLKFELKHGGYFEARRLPPAVREEEEDKSKQPERYEIAMPCFDPVPASPEEFERARLAVCKAFGRPDVKVLYVGAAREDAGKGSEIYLLIEVDIKEELGEVVVDTSAFIATAPREVNILTSRSRIPGIAYETRMFAPVAGVSEDPVCGSANCTMAPYWARKLPVFDGESKEMAALQVSRRGGRLWTEVDWERNKVLLRGEAKLMVRGTIYL